jgi:hypothetical protein
MAAPGDPVLSLDDVLELTLKGKSLAQGQEVINRMYYKVSSVPAVPTDRLSDALTFLGNNWATNAFPLLSVDYQLLEVVLKTVNGITVPPAVAGNLIYTYGLQYSPIAAFGTDAGVPLPSFIAASIWLQTGFVGRYWRGGMRLGTISATRRDLGAGLTNQWTAGYQTLLNVFCQTLDNTLTLPNLTTIKMGVLSRAFWIDVGLGITPPGDNIAYVNNANASDYVRHQDSRDAPRVP